MSEYSDQILTFLRHAWVAWSFWATLAGGAGASLVAGAFLAGPWLPSIVRKALFGAGTAILVLAAVYQAGSARAAHEASVANAEASLTAERTRAEHAELVMRRIAEQAARDLKTLSESNKRLEALNHDLETDKDRDRECVDRGTARRLRQL